MPNKSVQQHDGTNVIKFGGSILVDDNGFENAYNFSRKFGGRQVLVLSAVKGVTNRLLEIANTRDKQKIDEIILIHNRLAERKIADKEIYEEFSRRLKSYKRILEDKGASLATIGSLGERMSSDIFYGMMKSRGHDVNRVEVTRDFPIMVDGEEEDANPNIHETERRMNFLDEKFCNIDKIIFPGYLGVDGRGKIKLLGRGGSDTTAVLVAHGLGLDEVYLIKETKGVLTADPKIVPEARTVCHASYAEAENMSLFGASILHHKATSLSRNAKIKIRVPYINNPEIITRIDDEGENRQDVKLVCGFENCVMISESAEEMQRLEELCKKSNLTDFYHSLGGPMDRRESVILDRVKYQRLTGKNEKKYSVIGVVGDVMGRGKGYASRGSGALVNENINIVRDLSTERYNDEGAYMLYVVEPEDFVEGVKILHREFIEKN